MKHKILDITENELVNELDKQYKLGYEVIKFLSKQEPSAYSSYVSWKVLLRSVKK